MECGFTFSSICPVWFPLCLVFVFLAPSSAEEEQGISVCEVLFHSRLKAPCSRSSSIFPLHHVYLATSITRGWPSHWSFENAPGTNGRAVAMVQCIVAGWNLAARHVSVGVCLPPCTACNLLCALRTAECDSVEAGSTLRLEFSNVYIQPERVHCHTYS